MATDIIKGKKLTERDLSLSTKASKKVRGRVDDIPEDESKVFMEAVYNVLGTKGLAEMKGLSYWFKHDMLERNYRLIIDELETTEKGREIVDKLLVNKKAYFTDVIVHGRKFYRPLTWEQKLIVLTEMYKIYNFKEEELDTIENKKYRDSDVFIKVLDEGKIDQWSVSVTGYCDTTINLLENKVNISDVLFWLQNDWSKLSGDFFIKKNSNTLSRNTNIFEAKHYHAFNSVFKQVFKRDLKSVKDLPETNVENIIAKMTAGLEE